MWEKCESWASYLRRGGGQWVGGDFTLRSQSFFCFYQQDSSHPQPDFCLVFFVLAAPFCDNKGFTPSCCRSAMSHLVSLWRGGGLARLSHAAAFILQRAISFLLHGLQTVGHTQHMQVYLEMHLRAIDLNCCCWINLRHSLFCSPERKEKKSFLSFFVFVSRFLSSSAWNEDKTHISKGLVDPLGGCRASKQMLGAPNEVVVVVVTLLNLFGNIHM